MHFAVEIKFNILQRPTILVGVGNFYHPAITVSLSSSVITLPQPLQSITVLRRKPLNLYSGNVAFPAASILMKLANNTFALVN